MTLKMILVLLCIFIALTRKETEAKHLKHSNDGIDIF
jgi:hypothetical protein